MARALGNYTEFYEHFVQLFRPQEPEAYMTPLGEFLQADFLSVTTKLETKKSSSVDVFRPFKEGAALFKSEYERIIQELNTLSEDATTVVAANDRCAQLRADFQRLLQEHAPLLVRDFPEGYREQIQEMKGFFSTARLLTDIPAAPSFLSGSPFQAIMHCCVNNFPALHKTRDKKAVTALYKFMLDFMAAKKPCLTTIDTAAEAESRRIVEAGLQRAFALAPVGNNARECIEIIERQIMATVVLHPRVIPHLGNFTKGLDTPYLLTLLYSLPYRYEPQAYQKALAILGLEEASIAGLLINIQDLQAKLLSMSPIPEATVQEDDVFAEALNVKSALDLERARIKLRELKNFALPVAVKERVEKILGRILEVVDSSSDDISSAGEDSASLGSREEMYKALFARRVEGAIAEYKQRLQSTLQAHRLQFLASQESSVGAVAVNHAPIDLFVKHPVPWIIGQVDTAFVQGACFPLPFTKGLNTSAGIAAIRIPAVENADEVRAIRKLRIAPPIELVNFLEAGPRQITCEAGQRRRLAVEPSDRFAPLYALLEEKAVHGQFNEYIKYAAALHYMNSPVTALRPVDLEFILNGGDPASLIRELEGDLTRVELPMWDEILSGGGECVILC